MRRVVVFALAAALLVSCSGGSRAASSASPSVSATAARSTSTSPNATPTTTPTPTSSPTQTYSGVPIVYRGSGYKILTIHKPTRGSVIITTTIKGPYYQDTVWTLGYGLDRIIQLVGATGDYQGATLLDTGGEDTTRLEVRVKGTWTIKLSPELDAPTFETRVSGDGQAVLMYTGGRGFAHITADGPRGYGFTVFVVGSYLPVVDVIAPKQVTVPLEAGPSILEIFSSGKWTINVTSGRLI